MVSLHNRDSEIEPEPEEDGPYHDQTLWEQARWRTRSITVAEDPRDAWSGTGPRAANRYHGGPAGIDWDGVDDPAIQNHIVRRIQAILHDSIRGKQR